MIPSITCLVITAAVNTKATLIENKGLINITNLTTKAALNTKVAEIESKIHGFNNLAVRAVLNTKVRENENKLPDTTGVITTPEFNRSKAKISFDARLKEATKSLSSS